MAHFVADGMWVTADEQLPEKTGRSTDGVTGEMLGDAQTTARFDAITTLIPEFVVIYGLDSVIRWVSNSAARFAGRSDLVGKRTDVLVHPEDIKPLSRLVAEQLRNTDRSIPSPLILGRVKVASGSWRWVETTFVLADVNGEIEIITTSRDCHDRKLATDRLIEQASIDDLTGLANRHALIATLEDLALKHVPHCLLFCDIDDFKAINDQMGHRSGDLVLQHVARRIQCAVRPNDVVARIGGDEFLIVLLGSVAGDARAITLRIVESIAYPVELGGSTYKVKASLGIAQAKRGMTPEELIDAADAEMYASKRQRKTEYSPL